MIIKNKESLHLKILSGYAILGILVLGIIMAVWYEKRVFEEAEKQESEMLEQRKLANETFRRFIGLFLDNERAILWEHSDMEEYNRKEQRMLDAMIRLRDRYSDSAQILRIDTVMQLLADKKRHIKSLMDAPTTASRIDSLLSRELPELERRTSSHTTIITNRGSEPSAGIEKKKNLFSWLKRRSKKDREENVGNGGTEVRTRTDVQQLHAVRQFGEDIRTALVEQRRLFEVLSDSLEARNRILNRNIFRLINEFESEEMRSVEERHRRVSELREQAFFLICCISSVGLVFAVLLYLTIRHEIRLRHRYQQRLELSDKSNREMLEMRKRIILTLSHDIRGPLNAISGSAELAMGVRDRKRRSVYLENILSSSRHIMRLANSLLDISRLEEAKKTANELPFRLSGLSDRIAEEYTGMANDKGLLFEYRNGAGTDIVVKGDADRIEQIIDNLLSNAIKFTESGTVVFSCEYESCIFVVKVTDTGIGMDRETVERIFNPFEKAASNVSSDGFGLGLSIAKGLVNLLGGEIDVTSRKGYGSCFTVRIPLPMTDETVTENVTEPSVAGRLPQNVLLVDDDPLQLEIIGEMLERNGIRCRKCRHIKEVVRELRSMTHDILLTDIQMDGTDGFHLLHLLRNSQIGNSRSIPIVAMTARGDERKSAFEEAGFAGCIYKPFSSAELLAFLSGLWHDSGTGQVSSVCFGNLTSETDNREKIISMLIEESRNNRDALLACIEENDTDGQKETLHRMYPMWEMLGITNMLDDYRTCLHTDSTGPENLKTQACGVVDAIDWLIRMAEEELEKPREERL